MMTFCCRTYIHSYSKHSYQVSYYKYMCCCCCWFKKHNKHKSVFSFWECVVHVCRAKHLSFINLYLPQTLFYSYLQKPIGIMLNNYAYNLSLQSLLTIIYQNDCIQKIVNQIFVVWNKTTIVLEKTKTKKPKNQNQNQNILT